MAQKIYKLILYSVPDDQEVIDKLKVVLLNDFGIDQQKVKSILEFPPAVISENDSLKTTVELIRPIIEIGAGFQIAEITPEESKVFNHKDILKLLSGESEELVSGSLKVNRHRHATTQLAMLGQVPDESGSLESSKIELSDEEVDFELDDSEKEE